MRHLNKTTGFTLVEALVSVSILTIIGTIAIFDLRASSRTDALNTAARYLAADIRSLQSEALSVKNIKFCANGSAIQVVCETSTAVCQVPGNCMPIPPGAMGASFFANASSYALYAKYNSASVDWTNTIPGEIIQIHDLAKNGAPNVIISNLSATFLPQRADIAFLRQNGAMQLNACAGCTSSPKLSITLKQTQSGETRVVQLNQVTGRISIQ